MSHSNKERYFLKADHQKNYDEVTKEAYIKAEKAAGFFSNSGEDEAATSSFDGPGISGYIKE